MDIAPFRGLRYVTDRDRAGAPPAESLCAPPYDVISGEEHRRLLERSPHNLVRLTLGADPDAGPDYAGRAASLDQWVRDGVLVREDEPALWAYVCDYTVPGSEASNPPRRARFVGLTCLGRLHPFEDRIVLRHEETFPKVVDDRYRLLEATRANLESIFLLFADEERRVDALLEEAAREAPVVRVEARPGEVHSLHRIARPEAAALRDRLAAERPVIADGHHRYTTSLRYLREHPDVPGAGWRMVTLGNLHAEGLSILATHRMVRLVSGDAAAALGILRERLEPAGEDDWDITVEARDRTERFRFPSAVREGRHGVRSTSYALLHELVLGKWLAPLVGETPDVAYYKEGTGEAEALREGRGDLLFRLRPVARDEFRRVVEGGEVFPHKTTFFYPKLWSGLVLWRLEEPGDVSSG